MELSLSDRVADYVSLYDQQIMKRLPIVITLNGRSFGKATSLLEKPYCPQFTELMVAAMVKLTTEVDGVVFSYTYNDQIVVALRNDQTPSTDAWYGNRIQSIVSASSSIASVEFNRMATSRGIKIIGDPIFIGSVFAVPTVSELTNVMIHMQQQCFHKALSNAAFYELWKIYGANKATDMLDGKDLKSKADILARESGKEFADYPLPYKRGIAAYRAPKLGSRGSSETKYKITINDELPLFSHEKNWLHMILKTGADTYADEEKDPKAWHL